MPINRNPIYVGEPIATEVKFKDTFHLRNLYVMMHEMLLEEGWNGYNLDDHKDIETLYSENVFQKGIHRGGKEMWVWWRGKKDVEGRTHGNFVWVMDIDIHGAYFKEVEVIHQGKKLLVNQGELDIFFRARIEADYSGKMRSNKIMKYFQDIYQKRIMARDIEMWEKFLWRELYRIQGKVKSYLGLRTFVPVAEAFHPRKIGHEDVEQ